MPTLRRPLSLGLLCALAALALDQAHKWWMLNVLDIAARERITLTPFLDVMLSWNEGVSYSLLRGVGPGALLAGQGVIIAALVFWLWRAADRMTAAGLGLIIGGALGNAADRATRGAVADFFYFHTSLPVGPLANYVFNIADMAITFGVALLMWQSFAATSPPAEEAPMDAD